MIKKIAHYLLIIISRGILILILGFILKTSFSWHQNITNLMIDKTTYLNNVTISPTNKPAQKIILGRETLGQIKKGDSAERSHLALRFENNQWLISNIASHKRAYVYTDKGQQFFLKRRQVAIGDWINLGQQGIEITKITDHQLTLFDHNTQQQRQINRINPVFLDLTPVTLKPPLYNFKRCDGLNTDLSLIATWRKTMQGLKTSIVESKPIKLGGQIDCPEQFAIDHTPENSLQIVYSRGKFYYASGNNAQIVTIKRQNKIILASQAEYPIFDQSYGHINKIIVGRTRYQISQNNNHELIFKPLNHIHLFLTEKTIPNLQGLDKIKVNWSTLSYEEIASKPSSKGILVIVLIISVIILLLICFKKINLSMKIILCLSMFGACISIWFYFGQKEGTLYSPQILIDLLIFQWSCAALIIARRAIDLPFLHAVLSLLFWLLVTFLAGAGLDALSQLALGANDTQWRVYFDKQLYSLMAISFITVLFVALSKYQWWIPLTEQFIFNDQRLSFKKISIRIGTLYRFIPLTALALLYGLWLVMGTEAGVNGIQPVEPGKFFVLIILSIIVSMFFLAFSYGDAGKRILDIMVTGLPFLILMLLMFIITPLLKSDQSPILIIGLSLLFLTILIAFIFTLHLFSWQYHNLGRLEHFKDFNLKPLIIPLILFFICLMGTFGVYQGMKMISSLHDNPSEWLNNPDQKNSFHTIKERILAWKSPLQYPDESYQLRRAITLIAESPEKNQKIKINDFNSMAVPAVQDDFILSFYLYRFGNNAGKQLFLIQLLFISCLLLIAVRVYRWKKGDYRDTAVRQFLAFTVTGFAISQLIHWVIAWSNSFNFLPIMGQPMTWLSSGNSHLLGFALPGVLITLTALYSVKKVHLLN